MKNRIAQIRESRGLSQVKLADLVGTSGQMIGMLEAGKRGLTLRWMERLADALDVTPAELIDDGTRMRPISVIGTVHAEEWTSSEAWPAEQQYSISVPIDADHAQKTIFALEVHGPSMDEIYPEGTILICVAFTEPEPQVLCEGKRYIVRRTGDDGLLETTAKEYSARPDGVGRLWPRSQHPDFRTPLPFDTAERQATSIKALVIGSYIPE